MTSVQTIVSPPAVRQHGHGRNTPCVECNIDATAELEGVKQIVQKVLLSSQKRRSVLARLSFKLPRKKRHAGAAGSEAPTPPGSVVSDSVVIATEDMNPETLSLPPNSASLSSSPSNNGQTKEASKEAEKGQPETKGWLYKWTNYIKVRFFVFFF